jgi:histone RNA hairpin-binding protein
MICAKVPINWMVFLLEKNVKSKLTSLVRIFNHKYRVIGTFRRLKLKILLVFAEEQNEKKFDKLTKEEKLKSPFKRRLSSEKTDTSKVLNSDLKRTKTDLDGDEDDDYKVEEDDSYNVAESKRSRPESVSSTSIGRNGKSSKEIETDLATLNRREKQIEFGKNTIGYDNYVRLVPK